MWVPKLGVRTNLQRFRKSFDASTSDVNMVGLKRQIFGIQKSK